MSYLDSYIQALVGCHDILILGKSPVKWRQHPNMTLAVDWDVKHKKMNSGYAARFEHVRV